MSIYHLEQWMNEHIEGMANILVTLYPRLIEACEGDTTELMHLYDMMLIEILDAGYDQMETRAMQIEQYIRQGAEE